jgi:hypothetical protein
MFFAATVFRASGFIAPFNMGCATGGLDLSRGGAVLKAIKAMA